MSCSYVTFWAVVRKSSTSRLENLLASFALGLHDDTTCALERATGLTGSSPAALLALDEFLGGAKLRRIADVLGITHSGAVRLVAQLEDHGLVGRVTGSDRRNVEVHLTDEGRRRAAAAQRARRDVIRRALDHMTDGDAQDLERMLDLLITGSVGLRIEQRAAGDTPAWWCRTCDFEACGRTANRCPAQRAAAQIAPSDP